MRQALPEKRRKCDVMSIFNVTDEFVEKAFAIEEGRRVARDIGGSDPEFMCSTKVVEYLEQEFGKSSTVKMSAKPVDATEYPLMAAVDRATRSTF